MARASAWVGAGIAVLLLAVVAAAHAAGEEETVVSLEKVPQPILEAVRVRFPGAGVKGAARETEEGKLVYEVSIRHRDHDLDVTLTPDGSILLIEREVGAEELPSAVTTALREAYPGATFQSIEEIREAAQDREILAYYEVLLGAGSQRALEVQVTAEGKIVRVEKKDPALHDGE